jgi:hypothetical protein
MPASNITSEIHWTHKHTKKHATDFFGQLKGKVAKRVDDIAWKHANSMAYVLKHRQRLKGGYGKFPMWNGAEATPPSKKPSNKSFSGWYAKKEKKGLWTIRNDIVSNDVWSYSYIYNLIMGTRWSKKVRDSEKHDTPEGRLTKKGGKLFSKQMPHGLMPWLRIKRNDFKEAVRKEVGDVL